MSADRITDFSWFQGDKIDLTPTNVSYFGGYDSTPEPGEVSYWISGYHTVITFNDGGVKDILLQNINLNMIASDFII